MDLASIESSFKERVCSSIKLKQKGVDRYVVSTPFTFEDGDHLKIILKHEGDDPILTDEGHTFMHLSYYLNENEISTGTREKIISNAISMGFLENREGELIIKIKNNQYGDSLFSFIQSLIKISDITYLSKEKVATTFLEDLRSFVFENVVSSHIIENWSDPALDKNRRYIVDYRVNGLEKPLFIYGLTNDVKVQDATICILHYEKLNVNFNVIGIFEDQEEIGKKVLAQFSDVCRNQYSTLYSNKDRIKSNLGEILPPEYLIA